MAYFRKETNPQPIFPDEGTLTNTVVGVPQPPAAHVHPAAQISDSTAVGRALMAAPDPFAIRFFRINADNTISELSDADFRTAIGAGSSTLVIGTTAGTACEGNDARLSDARTPTAHTLDGALHTITGKTAGHFLKALSATTYGFAPHGLTAGDVGADPAGTAAAAIAPWWTLAAETHFTSGFLSRTDNTLSLSTRTLTIAPTGANFAIYLDAVKILKTGGASCSTTIPATVGLHFIYFDATGALQNSMSAWSIIAGLAPVATIYWNGTAGAVSDERHGAQRNLAWHEWAHDTISTRYESGLIQTYPTGAQSKIQIESGHIHDEDIDFSIAQQTLCRNWYETAASTYTWANGVDNAGNDRPYLWNAGTSRVQYPKSDAAYALTDAGANEYVVVWAYASTDIDRPIYILTGSKTSAFNNIAAARAAAAPSTIGFLTPEMKLIYRWIFKGDGTFQESTDYRTSTSLPGGGTTAVNALNVSYTPTGNIAATNVQNAIDELDTEKAAVNASTTGSAASLKSPSTTGLAQLTGMAAGSTRVITVPDANATMARTDAAQTFAGTQTFSGVVNILGASTIGITVRTNRISSEEYDGVTTISFNYHGYLNGTTQFRNFSVYDGKETRLLFVEGSTGVTTLNSVLDLTTGKVIKINGFQVVGARQAAIADVASADATDLTTVIALANELKTKLNLSLAKDRTHGLIAT